MSKSVKTYTDGYAVGEDSEGNSWAWGRKQVGAGKNKLTVYDAQKLVYPAPYSRPIIYVADQFLTKQEAIDFCKTHCVKVYPGA